MKLLPKDQIELHVEGDYIIAGIYEHKGYMHWLRYNRSELPNDLISADDLKRFGIDIVDMHAGGGEKRL